MSEGDEDFDILSHSEEEVEKNETGDEQITEDPYDSDQELQVAFKKGLLKPGLNYATEAPRETINNTNAMKEKISQFKQTIRFPERIDIIPSKAILAVSKGEKKSKSNSLGITEVEEVDDDFKREMAFTQLAQFAVLEVIPRLHSAGIVTKRPEDYFAEMVKADKHMQRIREKLVQKKSELEVRNRARQLRQLRKESKYIQQEVLKRRQAEKKLLNEAAKKFSNDNKSKEDLEEMLSNKKKPNHQQSQKKKEPSRGNKRRDWKNTKFGHGGQKKRSKWNTADSVDDPSSHKRKPTGAFARVNRNKSSSGKKLKKYRPGKTSRAQARGQRGAGSRKR